jgi:uncharacterized protein
MNALALLKKRCAPDIVKHSLLNAQRSVHIAKRLEKSGYRVNTSLVRDGALLHDIGRSITHGLAHGYEGALLLRRLGFDERVARIAERHVLGGIGAAEARSFGLPGRDFIPITLEEKIVCYADKQDASKIERIKRKLGKNSTAYKRLEHLVFEMEEKLCKRVRDIDVYVVLKRNDRILLLQRSDNALWEFPGGGIEWGESPEAAARREVLEETGLKARVKRLLCVTSRTFEKNETPKHAIYVVFEGAAKGEPKLSGEHCAYKWASLAEAKKMKLGYNAADVLPYLRNK